MACRLLMNIKARFGAIIRAMPGSQPQRETLRLADAARDRKDYQVAAKLYDQALRSAAPNVDVLLLLQCGHMHKDAGNLPEAEARYLQALSAEPKNAEVLLQLGHFYKLAGRRADAKTYYQEALVARPRLKDAGDGLRRLGTAPSFNSRGGLSNGSIQPAGWCRRNLTNSTAAFASRTSPPCG